MTLFMDSGKNYATVAPGSGLVAVASDNSRKTVTIFYAIGNTVAVTGADAAGKFQKGVTTITWTAKDQAVRDQSVRPGCLVCLSFCRETRRPPAPAL
jgi:hypothetical protein